MKRICKKCGEEKEIEEFVKNNRSKYGHTWCCLQCRRIYARVWTRTPMGNALVKRYNKTYSESHRGKATYTAYRQKNKERIAAVNRKYYLDNGKEKLTKVKKYAQRNKIKIAAYQKQYRWDRIKQCAEYQKRHYQQYRETALKYNRLRVVTLPGGYIKTKIKEQTGICHNDITSEMVDLKRMQLKFHRELIKGKEVLNEVYSNV